MRLVLSRLFKALPSDLFSFVAGSIFAVFINLETMKVDPHKSLGLPLGLLALSTVGFICLVLVLNAASESAAKDSSADAYFLSVYDRLPLIASLLAASVLVLGYALWKLSH
jgi:hypothetical protein